MYPHSESKFQRKDISMEIQLTRFEKKDFSSEHLLQDWRKFGLSTAKAFFYKLS